MIVIWAAVGHGKKEGRSQWGSVGPNRRPDFWGWGAGWGIGEPPRILVRAWPYHLSHFSFPDLENPNEVQWFSGSLDRRSLGRKPPTMGGVCWREAGRKGPLAGRYVPRKRQRETLSAQTGQRCWTGSRRAHPQRPSCSASPATARQTPPASRPRGSASASLPRPGSTVPLCRQPCSSVSGPCHREKKAAAALLWNPDMKKNREAFF